MDIPAEVLKDAPPILLAIYLIFREHRPKQLTALEQRLMRVEEHSEKSHRMLVRLCQQHTPPLEYDR